jgi:hypothetical protein
MARSRPHRRPKPAPAGTMPGRPLLPALGGSSPDPCREASLGGVAARGSCGGVGDVVESVVGGGGWTAPAATTASASAASSCASRSPPRRPGPNGLARAPRPAAFPFPLAPLPSLLFTTPVVEDARRRWERTRAAGLARRRCGALSFLRWLLETGVFGCVTLWCCVTQMKK